jgi:dipeptidyl aminopeptidase/acylaminoacyl peptidase
VTSQALLDMRYPSDITLSPDGKRVAFVVWDWVEDKPKQRGNIWVVETSGGEARPFSKRKHEETCPRWSPDSKRLAFTAKGEGEKDKPQLYVIQAEGGEAKQVCAIPNGVSDLQWSPDGSRIAFISLEGEEPKTDPIVVTPGRHHRLWTVRPDYDIPEPVTPDGVSVWEYAWSPDSKQLALYYSTGPDDTDWFHGQIGVVAASGSAVRQVSRLTRQASSVIWSTDGTRLAYISGAWSDPIRGGGDMFVLPLAEGSEARNLTPNVEFSATWCRWFPDNRHIIFTCVKGVTQQVCILDESSGSITVLEEDFVMQWDQPILAPTSDLRSFATSHSCQRHPSDIWFGELLDEGNAGQSIQWRRLTCLNPIAEATLAVAPSERIRFKSVDGELVEALFTPPLFRKNDKLPALFVNVHGGPSGAWCDDWGAFYTQLLASAGYAVLRTNYRGSWGRGVAFADGVLGDMGGKDFQDLVYGIDYLVERGLVDGNRLAIGGWSNGGYLAAWAVTQTTRFKASVMGAGISDWHNMHAQTNIADADILLLGADPLENPEVYRKHSPITYAGQVTTPTLILHGEKDPAVPVAQAYTFYRALRERNIPVELVVYPREGHGLNERAHILDSEERMLRWLERYL